MCPCVTRDANSARSRFWTVTHGRRGRDCASTADNPSPSCCWGTRLHAGAPAQERAPWALLALIGVTSLLASFSVLYIHLSARVSRNHSGLCMVGKTHGPMSPLTCVP